MLNPRFQIQIGTSLLDSQVPSSLNSVVEVVVELEMNETVNLFSLTLGVADGFSVSRGDHTVAQLGYDEELTTVFSGEVKQISPEIEGQVVKSFDAGGKLLSLRTNQSYEQQTAGDIVSDLASRAGVMVANAESGIEYPFYVIDDSKNGFEHIRELAEKNGFDFYVDPKNQLVFQPLTTTVPVKTFRYGVDILEVEVLHQAPTFQKAEVRGESPASSLGVEKAHWLVKSFDDSLGVAGAVSPTLYIQDPAVKTKVAADIVATAAVNHRVRRAISGRVKILGTPAVKPGDVIAFADSPDDRLNGSFQVRGISHLFNKSQGFISALRVQDLGNA